MAKKTKEEKKQLFDKIVKKVSNGQALRTAIKEEKMSAETFYKWINEDEELAKQYARACESRADAIFEEILSIADDTSQDHTPFTGVNVIQRDRVRIDARKWMLGKLMPKKYGDKLDIEQSGEITISFKD